MLQIIGYTIPSIVVFTTVWVVMHYYYKNEEKKRLAETNKQSKKEIMQTRLRAYERLSLLLERTEPEHLLADTDITNTDIISLQQRLLRTVRQEFDHNLSQQIYVSDDLWDKIIVARDEMGAFISTMAMEMPKDSTALDYAKVLITAYKQNGVTPHQNAMNLLKQEVRELLQ